MEAGFTGLCPVKLDLSNTPIPGKTLSFSKPPHLRSSFAAFQSILDGNTAPGKGKGRNPSGFCHRCSTLFRQQVGAGSYL